MEKLKGAAAADPEKFAQELADGKLSKKDQGGIVDLNHDDEDNEENEETADASQNSKIGSIPAPQNVVRMPPVNWAKYKVVGESLDKMHEEQLLRPSIGEPRREEAPAPEYMLASPYQPLADKLESPSKGKRANNRRKT